ncbi:PqqD family protein [Halobacteriovorax sp. HLS]|uniref:PqqD family protein n=1 Tax=Halobacteriovorax sp. HLS TaxID=2234000 RepID=UPI000FDC8529|nr:PqqD family protein [Halobacteriovorax sp. HLS]
MNSLRKTKFLSWKKSPTHTLIIDSRSKKQIHRLNEVGSFLWESIDKVQSCEELLQLLTSEYDIDNEQAKQDIEIFITDLNEKGLLGG